jgi:hypothetical protein
MSKKSKKQYRDGGKISGGSASVISSRSDEFNPDYSDVIKDLKRIGALAVVFFAVLVALSFVL